MSLIATASPWNAGETTKRVSTLRKTIKKTAGIPDTIPDYNARTTNELQGSVYQDTEPTNESSTVEKSVFGINPPDSKRSEKVLELMNNLNPDNDGTHLANFNPPPAMGSAPLKPAQPIPSADPHIEPLQNEFQLASPAAQFQRSSENRFYPTSPETNFSNYRQSYLNQGQNRYLASGTDGISTKLMDKINYMIHMLEQQQNERTEHIMEEFILYTLLGVFIIFVVDAFARSGNGKYVR
jgi:hypothetical protein